MKRRLFYAGKITPRRPGSLLIYGGIDPFTNEAPVQSNIDPLFEQILASWTEQAPTAEPLSEADCYCEHPCEENNWTEILCIYHQHTDPRGD